MARMATEPLRALLAQAFPDASELDVLDRTGTGDHFQVTVTSGRFEGLPLVEQHRLVGNGAVGDTALLIGDVLGVRGHRIPHGEGSADRQSFAWHRPPEA